MRKNGVSVGAALAFWLGNPTLNPAILVFLVFALSWKWALLRLVGGLILVFGVAFFAGRLFAEETGLTTDLPGLDAPPGADPAPLAERWLRNFARLALGLLPEYLVLVLLLGATRGWLFPTAHLGDGALAILSMAIVGAAFVIPTAGEIPIVQTMLGAGLAVGPAGALLMTLAPISAPSVAMVWSVFPKRALALVAASVVVLGIVSALAAVVLGF